MLVTSLSTLTTVFFAIGFTVSLFGFWEFLYQQNCISEVFGSKGYSGSTKTTTVLFGIFLLGVTSAGIIIFLNGYLSISFLFFFIVLAVLIMLSYMVGAAMPFLE